VVDLRVVRPPRLRPVEDEHRAQGASEVDRRRQAGGAAANDGSVAVEVFGHLQLRTGRKAVVSSEEDEVLLIGPPRLMKCTFGAALRDPCHSQYRDSGT
jgi:hypothetical protein